MLKTACELPITEVSPTLALKKRTRRILSTYYKPKILAEAERCAYGELAALLRREKLYSAQLQPLWRRVGDRVSRGLLHR